jgi:hypothetical protein
MSLAIPCQWEPALLNTVGKKCNKAGSCSRQSLGVVDFLEGFELQHIHYWQFSCSTEMQSEMVLITPSATGGHVGPNTPCGAVEQCFVTDNVFLDCRYAWSYVETNHNVKKGERVWQLGFGSGFKCCSATWKALRTIHDQHDAWTETPSC